ncbi:MAG: tRNA-dihydrouridine synthase family protein [Proteobacteria bacterium]|nr:tRNA-dihydrouridine synthase family protein [Pseudomonadota bacterium]
MEGVSNLPMRLWWHLASAPSALATPFLRVTATFPGSALPRSFCPELTELRSYLPYPLVPQLMAADSADFVRAAPLILTVSPFVELNAGCPSPTCVGKGAGSSLLRQGDEFHSFVGELQQGLGAKSVAVKMRTGFQSPEEFSHLISGLSDYALARLTVHGRTRPQRYSGQARWDLIAAASTSLATAVVASGDVVGQASLDQRLTTAPQVAGVLVGRGALRNPWIFQELRTGAPVRLSFTALRYALISHALLHELYQDDMDRLFELCKSGLFSRSCSTDEEAWRQLQATLAKAVYGADHPGFAEGAQQDHLWPLARQSMGRLKMLWNYLRSSLPPVFFAPTLLRSNSLEAFLDHLGRLYAEHRNQGGLAELELAHQATWDWLYSGEKQQQAAVCL